MHHHQYDLKISILGIWKVHNWNVGFAFVHFVYKGSFGQMCIKITECSI